MRQFDFFAIFAGEETEFLPETPGEVGMIGEARLVGDPGDRQIALAQHPCGAEHAVIGEIFPRGAPGRFAEESLHRAYRKMVFPGGNANGDDPGVASRQTLFLLRRTICVGGVGPRGVDGKISDDSGGRGGAVDDPLQPRCVTPPGCGRPDRPACGAADFGVLRDANRQCAGR